MKRWAVMASRSGLVSKVEPMQPEPVSAYNRPKPPRLGVQRLGEAFPTASEHRTVDRGALPAGTN
uniref:Uncharacterized protein n=1 Tax=uncultured bacterium 1042 TaxID=548897 RepID=B8R8V3_9BACT|nr:hypothetical protein [uncultured bacterium 1042]